MLLDFHLLFSLTFKPLINTQRMANTSDLCLFSILFQYQRTMSTILNERKRFNYNVGTAQNTRSSHSQKKLNINPIIPASLIRDQNSHVVKAFEVKEANKKIEELEAINRKIVEDTTEQFKNLELDVQRVQKILEEKELHINELVTGKKQLEESLVQANEEKKILIEAIFEKDLVIKQFQEKLKDFLKESKPISNEVMNAQTFQSQAQTDPMPELGLKNELNVYTSKNRDLEDELYETKEDLFDAQNKLKLLTQQFEAYKLLKQIESVQDV